MADIKIVVDTGSDIPEEVLEKYDIGIISFITLFGEKQYVQRRDITNSLICKRVLTAYREAPRRPTATCTTISRSSVRSMTA